MIEPEYLGDSVYIHLDIDGTVVLTTGDHNPGKASAVIYLDEDVLRKLRAWLDRLSASKE